MVPKNHDLKCVLRPSTNGWGQNTSRIQEKRSLTHIFFMIASLALQSHESGMITSFNEFSSGKVRHHHLLGRHISAFLWGATSQRSFPYFGAPHLSVPFHTFLY